MRFLADECFDGRLVRALRRDGHDVLAAAESMAGASDTVVLSRAFDDERIVLTEDTDFGELVYRLSLRTRGVLLLRLDPSPVDIKWKRLSDSLVDPSRVVGHFVVVDLRQTRFRALPRL